MGEEDKQAEETTKAKAIIGSAARKLDAGKKGEKGNSRKTKTPVAMMTPKSATPEATVVGTGEKIDKVLATVLEDDDGYEPSDRAVKIMQHRPNRGKGEVKVLYADTKIYWVPIYSIWADWPELVKQYRNKWGQNKWHKMFDNPTRKYAKTVETIYFHLGSIKKPEKAMYNVVYNNGFTMTELNAMSYSEVHAEAPEQLAAYLHQERTWLGGK